MAELEREKNVREKAEVERDEVDRLKRKVKEVRKEVSVRPKNRNKGGKVEMG